MADKERVNDCIASQKYMTGAYNTFAGECVNEQLRGEFLNILKDEHTIQADLWGDANARGWYAVKPAPPNEISMTLQKYTTNN
jgi:hypothetical protein